jgi:acyl carrier protein
VLTLLLPQVTETIPTFLQHVWPFDHKKTTEEDRERTALYREHFMREQFRRTTPTLSDFLASLNLDIRISELRDDEISRASELTLRTNQFNLTDLRRSEADIQQVCNSGNAQCLAVRVRDRFGDYGLVGVIVFSSRRDSVFTDTFLLSCRALGKGVEHAMLARLGEIAREYSKEFVDLCFVPTAKNRPAVDFIDSLSAAVKRQLDKGWAVRLPAELAAGTTYDPDGNRTSGQLSSELSGLEHAAEASLADENRRREEMIFETLHDPEVIYGRITQTRIRRNLLTGKTKPRTRMESKIASFYAELLGVDEIGVHDPFFELGGHSLLAMQILSRINQAFDVGLDPMLLFTTKFTVAELAEEAQKDHMKQAKSQDLDALFDQIAAITDEEAETLVNKPLFDPEPAKPIK